MFDRITLYLEGDHQRFYSDSKTQDAILRNLQIMAESTQRLSEERKAAAPEIEWYKIAGFRNVLVHAYLGVNLKQVIQIIEQDLPGLRQAVEKMLAEMGG